MIEQGDETILRNVLNRWKDGVDAHEPKDVSAIFTEDAIFQGLHPYTVGRKGVADYYDSQPIGMTPDYQLLETRRLADDAVLGYLSVTFAFTDRPSLRVWLSIVAVDSGAGWQISHYQVSYLPEPGRSDQIEP